MNLGVRGPAKREDLQPINEEGPDGKPVSDQIYLDPDDPKKKKYDELKKKALLLAKRKEKKRKGSNGEDVSDTSSVKSGISKTSDSSIGISSISAGTTSSVAGPFLTHARAPRSEAQRTVRQSTPPRTESDGLNSFK